MICNRFFLHLFFFVTVYRSMSSVSNDSSTILPEETSIVEKVEQISIQSKWLRRNQQILSGLYEHCLMVGTGDPELPGKN